jgi:hypothetical protein
VPTRTTGCGVKSCGRRRWGLPRSRRGGRCLAGSRSLQRAFFSPTFALACERAIGRTYVVVLHDDASIRGFLPFQFRSAWHERLRLAERIGGDLSDASGVIAWPDLRINSTLLMRLAGLASLFINHLMEDQGQFGIEATWSRVGYVTDVHTGPSAYFAAMNGVRGMRNTSASWRLRRPGTVTPTGPAVAYDRSSRGPGSRWNGDFNAHARTPDGTSPRNDQR